MAIKVKLRKSLSSRSPEQRATVRGLGLGKMDSEKILADTPAIRGMIAKVAHMVEVEEVPGEAPRRVRRKRTAASKEA